MSLLYKTSLEPNPGSFLRCYPFNRFFQFFLEEDIIKHIFCSPFLVQSISKKLDLIEVELQNFYMLDYTWLDQRTTDASLKLNDFKLCRRDRPGERYNGIQVYMRNNVYPCRWDDIEQPNIECICIEVLV